MAKILKNKKININHSQCVFIVENLIKKTERTNYANQIKMAKRMLKERNMGFWKFLKVRLEDPSVKKPLSLSYYLTEKGKNYFKFHDSTFENYKSMKIPERKELTLSEDVVSSCEEVESVPKTRLEFIKKYA